MALNPRSSLTFRIARTAQPRASSSTQIHKAHSNPLRLRSNQRPYGAESKVRPFGPRTVTASAVTSKTAKTAQTIRTSRS